MRRIVIVVAFILGGLLIQNSSEAAMADSMGLHDLSKKAAKQLAKANKKALKHNKKNGGHIPPGTVSPCTTFLAQVLCSEENLFLLIHDAYDLNLIGRHKTKRAVKKIVRADFKLVGRQARKEFKRFNNGAKKKQVRRDYLAFMFKGGVLPLYY